MTGSFVLFTFLRFSEGQDLQWTTGPSADGIPTQPRPRLTRRLATRGAVLYGKRCASCHGPTGRGDGRAANGLRIPPRDFTSAVYKIRSTPTGSLPLDLDLFETVSRGLHGTAMRPWGLLSEYDRWALVVHLKSLSPRFRSERPVPPVTVPSVPHDVLELVPRGRDLYRLVQCHTCHGDEGRGDGAGAVAYQADPSRPVRLRRLDTESFIRGTELKDIFLTLITGLDGTPMGAYQGLSAEDLWALAVFVRQGIKDLP